MGLPAQPLRNRFLNRLDAHLREELAIPAGAVLRVGYSGGVDSTALLAAIRALVPVRGFAVAALHVDHGLLPEAPRWEEHCRRICEELGVPLQILRWRGKASNGQSLEAAARAGRYALMEKELSEGECLLTAHHAEDQAETVLLFLLRGAGLDGLSGIEKWRQCGAGWLVRPLLPFRRAELQEFVDGCGLTGVVDPTNHNVQLARSRVRHQVLPCLTEVTGESVVAPVARSAAHLQDARQVLDRVVAEALEEVWIPRANPPSIDAVSLAGMDEATARLVLRAALRKVGFDPPTRVILEQIHQLARRSTGEGVVEWGGKGGVHRIGGRLVLAPPPTTPKGGPCPALWVPCSHPSLEWPALGLTLSAEWVEAVTGPPWPPSQEGHLVAARAVNEAVWMRLRRGGEWIRPAGGQYHKRLKELLREGGVPARLRDWIPLCVDSQGQILAVVGVTTTEIGAVQPGEPAWWIRLHWTVSPFAPP